MADDPKKPSLVKALGRSATSITNIVVAGTAAVGALALHSWAIVAVGGAAYAALMAWDLTTGAGKKHDDASRLGAAEDYADPQTRAMVKLIAGARREIDRVIGETTPDVQASLAFVVISVGELEARAAKLAVRAEDLARYLATTDLHAVEADVEVLAARVRQARDAEAKAQYEGAHAARTEHLQTLNELLNAKERIAASLLGIAATLDGLPAKIVKMRALDAQAMDRLTGNVREELDRMNGEIKIFEETLKSLGEVSS